MGQGELPRLENSRGTAVSLGSVAVHVHRATMFSSKGGGEGRERGVKGEALPCGVPGYPSHRAAAPTQPEHSEPESPTCVPTGNKRAGPRAGPLRPHNIHDKHVKGTAQAVGALSAALKKW